MEEKDWVSLDLEILIRIFSDLRFSHQDYSRIRRVNKRWRAIVDVWMRKIPCQNRAQPYPDKCYKFFWFNPSLELPVPHATLICQPCLSFFEKIKEIYRELCSHGPELD